MRAIHPRHQPTLREVVVEALCFADILTQNDRRLDDTLNRTAAA
jgi:hypothetical protein